MPRKSPVPFSPQPVPARAPHVQASLASVQAKPSELTHPAQAPAAHVKAAFAAVQLKQSAPSPASARHAQGLAATRGCDSPSDRPLPALHSQAAQAKPSPSPATRQPVAPHVKAALGHTAQAKPPRRLPVEGATVQRSLEKSKEESKEKSKEESKEKPKEESKSKINAGGKKYDNDMLKGGVGTVAVNVDIFYKLWVSSQRDKNICEPAVKEYLELIENKGGIDAPFVDSIDFDEKGISIRTSDGRHRITAAKRAGLKIIYILRPSKTEIQYTEIGEVKDALFPEGA